MCQDNDRINVVSIATNTKLYSIGGQDELSEDDDEMDNNLNDLIYTFALSSNDELIVTAHKSGLLKLWLRKSLTNTTTIPNNYESIVDNNNPENEDSTADSGKLLKQWKSLHQGPITKLTFHKNNEIIASAGVDSKIRLWNFEQKLCFATFHLNQGVISILSFVPEFKETKKRQSAALAVDEKLIITCGDDNIINCWNYGSKKLKFKLNGHLSKVTSVTYSFSDDADDDDDDDIKNYNHKLYYLISSSRDKVIIVWDLYSGNQLYVVPVYECIESVIYLNPLSKLKLPNNIKLNDKEMIYALTGGEFGIIKIWELKTGQLIYTQTNSLIAKSASLSSTATTDDSDMENLNTGDLLIYQCLYNEKLLKFTIITVDHNILIYNINTFYCNKQLIGFTDDILDLILFGKNGRYLALATNSNDIKIYDTLNMNCQLLKGHTDIVLTLSAYKHFLLSAGKDMTIYLWEIDSSNFTIKCRGIGKKHTAAIGSITFGRISNNIFASVSQDTCLKVWNIPKTIIKSSAAPVTTVTTTNTIENDSIIPLNCIATQIAHEKDVNCVTMSPNDKMLATGSQDKTAKLWNCMDLSLIGVFRGHKRGIWCVRFSPIDQIILTTSADCTMKLWSIVDMSCLKTFEGHHTSSILRGEFLNKGLQILSAGSDGLIKLWCIKTSECLKTLDKHTNRVWALTIAPDETYFYSGGSDSILMKWKDVTDEEKLTKQLQQNELILQEQKLMNLLQENDVLKALCLAIKLRKPNLTLRIITNIIKEDNINEYQNVQNTNLKETIKQLDDTEKEILFKHAITWNTIGKNSLPAQIIINIFLTEILLGTFKPNGLSKFIEDTLPYTDRHFRRMTQYLLDLKYLEFIKSSMQQHMV